MYKYILLLSLAFPLSGLACSEEEKKSTVEIQLEKLHEDRRSSNWKCVELPMEGFVPWLCQLQGTEQLELAAIVERGPRFLCGKGPSLIALHRCGGGNEHPLCSRYRIGIESHKEEFINLMKKL